MIFYKQKGLLWSPLFWRQIQCNLSSPSMAGRRRISKRTVQAESSDSDSDSEFYEIEAIEDCRTYRNVSPLAVRTQVFNV